MTFETLKVNFNAFLKIDANCVRVERRGTVEDASIFTDLDAAVAYLFNLDGIVNDPLGEKKPSR